MTIEGMGGGAALLKGPGENTAMVQLLRQGYDLCNNIHICGI